MTRAPVSTRATKLPAVPSPQLATLVHDVPTGERWLHEIKFDGFRILVPVAGNTSRLISRSGKDWTARFPAVAEAAASLGAGSLLLDGEAVVLDDRGISRFQALQNAEHARGRARLHYYAFDLLRLDGEDLRRRPLIERKELLRTVLEARNGDRDVIRYSDHIIGDGDAFFDHACETGLEGIISKRADSHYASGRSRDWLKVKCLCRQEFVIAGFTEPQGSRASFGALLLGVHEGDDLVYAGRVGTGFTAGSLRELHGRLEPLERDRPLLANPPRGARARNVHWVEPALVAEVAFTEWTADGLIRHPSFQGLREDKDPRAVVREDPQCGGTASAGGSPPRAAGTRAKGKGGQVRIAGVTLTSPDRVVWDDQGVTKLELARYYEAVMERMLPHVADRPLTLVRCPSGAGRGCFYQKHWGEGMPESVPRIMVKERDGTEPYMYVDGPTAVIALVQLGVLEFHVWGSRRDRLDRPDLMIFDLDPDEGLAWDATRTGALALRDRLTELGLESFVKTTGGKGLHVVAPLVRRSTWADVRDFAEAVAREFVRAEPKRYTAAVSKRSRKGRIFIDYLRNAANSTSIAAWSTRARPGAPVSVPIGWRELEITEERPAYTIRDVPGRIAGRGRDPWVGWDEVRQSITAATRREVGLRR